LLACEGRRVAAGQVGVRLLALPTRPRRLGAGCSAPLRCRGAQGSWPRAPARFVIWLRRVCLSVATAGRAASLRRATRPSTAGESLRSSDHRSEAPQPAPRRLGRAGLDSIDHRQPL